MSLLHLTARKIGPAAQTLRTPKVFTMESTDINMIQPHVAVGGSVVKSKIGGRGAALEIWAAETPAQIEVLKDPASTNVLAQDKQLGMTAAGTTQGAGTAITKYLSEFTTIGAGATEAATLDAATVGKVRVVLNNDAASDNLEIFPAVGENFEGSAVNGSQTLAGSAKVHLYCEVAGVWQIATQ